MVRKLKRLEIDHTDINTQLLDSHGYCTYELALSPFSNLTPRNPPGWYLREYVGSLYRVASNWRSTLEKNYENYYLAIWIFSPRESKTQLVAAVGERIDYYKNLFKRKKEDSSFPQSIQTTENTDKWKAHWDYEPFWKDEDELNENDYTYLKKVSAYEERIGEETYYLIPQGTVWVNEEIPNQALQTTSASARRLS